MDEHPGRNSDLELPDIFSGINNYFLLFFALSCIISSLYLQQIFIMMGQYQVGISASAVLAVIIPVYLVTRRFAPGFRAQLRLALPRTPQLVYVLLATCAVVIVVDQIYLISQHFKPAPVEYADSLKELKPTSTMAFILTFMGLCLLVPLAEELVFRGLVQQIFSRNIGPVFGFVLAGLLFGAGHLNAHLLVSISFFGVFLGFVFYATGNLTYTIIAHGLFNTIALVQLTMTPEVEQSNLPFYLTDVRIFVVAAVLLIFFLAKIKQGGSETEPPYSSETEE